MKKEFKKKMRNCSVVLELDLVKKARKLNPTKRFEKYCSDLIIKDNAKFKLELLLIELKLIDDVLGNNYVTNVILNR
jgi:hypothetical protein